MTNRHGHRADYVPSAKPVTEAQTRPTKSAITLTDRSDLVLCLCRWAHQAYALRPDTTRNLLTSYTRL